MRRISVEVAATVLLAGFLLALAQPRPACGCSFPRPVKVSELVRPRPGWSVGLVTVTAGGGDVRTDPTTGAAETSVKIVPTSWTGTVPTTLWFPNVVDPHPLKKRLLLRTVVSSPRLSLAAFWPGTQWVVRVRNADARMRFPLPVVGNAVRTPGGRVIDDVDDANPMKVNLDALRRRAQRR